jgi:hypothetical protein
VCNIALAGLAVLTGFDQDARRATALGEVIVLRETRFEEK